jgi:hypothetical protein
MWADGKIVADIIPVDIVANCTIAVGWRTARLGGLVDVVDNAVRETPASNASAASHMQQHPIQAADEGELV